MSQPQTAAAARLNSPAKVLGASLVGTAIEFYDYYIYATAAVLVFGPLFFPTASPAAQTLLSLSTFSIAFIARPVGSALFGHYGDRLGRKTTLVASLLVMGLSTFFIGLLPGEGQIGLAAPVLLCLLRFGQGLGLGGEWGGAALVATENAPPGRRGLFGSFPQLGAPIGLLLANGAFFAVSSSMSPEDFMSWGWRIPFLASAVLVMVGLYVRLSLEESPVYRQAEAQGKKVKVPLARVFGQHGGAMLIGTLIMVATYVLFYLMTVFSQKYSVSPAATNAAGIVTGLGINKSLFLEMLMGATLLFGAFTLISGWLSDIIGRRTLLIWTTVAIAIFGFVLLPQLLGQGTPGGVMIFLVLGMTLMGLTFGPMAAILPELFPTEVRYTGASLAYNLASILGASVATLVAVGLNDSYGLKGVGIYLGVCALVTLVALLMARETSRDDLAQR
ncbi:MFS transporter [Amphibiibacter pelophylacis]|uniref:MFS transporter n=1 Tax=Amphibiibacter pelophylacis TaxID=1799477 RepID=A0ACC6P2F2_9BURK